MHCRNCLIILADLHQLVWDNKPKINIFDNLALINTVKKGKIPDTGTVCMKIKYLLVSLCCLMLNSASFAAVSSDEQFYYCGPGYVLATDTKTDGINTYECQKLWCRDLENGKTMGTGDSVASGYKVTAAPVELCDADGDCIQCFGDRKWCAGEQAGRWNPEYGAYTRGGSDNSTYGSYQKGNCFTWRLEKPTCDDGESAILQNGKWICATSSNTGQIGDYGYGIRRTGSFRRSTIR